MIAGTAAAAGGALLSKTPAVRRSAASDGCSRRGDSARSSVIRPRRRARRPPPSANARRSSSPSARRSATITGTTLTPLQDLAGTITPADLHFARIHSGIPTIDPATHTLLIHGLVDRPMSFSVADIKRFPSVTRDALHRVLRQRPLGVPHAQARHDAAAGRRDDEQQRMDRRSAVAPAPRSRA